MPICWWKNASGATATVVPSTDKATISPAEGEKDVDTNPKNELVDLLGIDIVTQYYNKKLLYEKYCEKMKKRRQSSKIINCDVLTKKGPISVKVYREDGIAEVIEKFKASDLQLAEWKEKTEKELHIDFKKSLQEQDPLNELNDLANKKRKRTGDSTDHSSISSLGPFEIGKYLHFSVCSGTETKECPWLELQFSLVDNSKLNVVYLINRS
ncbi:hypothetical protein Tco_1116674 [Tanacetum coccineum]